MKEYILADVSWQIIVFIIFSLLSWIYQMYKKNFSESSDKNKKQPNNFPKNEEDFPWLKNLKQEFEEVKEEKKEFVHTYEERLEEEEEVMYQTTGKEEEVDDLISRAEEAERLIDENIPSGKMQVTGNNKRRVAHKLPLLKSRNGLKQAFIYSEILKRKY